MIRKKRISNNDQGTPNIEVSYTYDSLDRLVAEKRTADGSSAQTQSYTYDLAGNRLSKTSDGLRTTYALGPGNRLASSTATATNTYFVSGTSSETIGTDNQWGTLYISNLTANTGVVPDVNGSSFSAEVPVLGSTTNTLIAAIRDEAGNMGYATNEVFVTSSSGGAMSSSSVYEYDTAGCLTNLNGITLEWDERYRLTKVDGASSSVEYAYDVLGRRTTRIENGSTNYFIYNGNQIVADLGGSGNVLRTYVWGTGIDNLLCFTDHTSSNTYYAVKDHQNTVLALVDELGVAVESYEYTTYGETTVFDASGTELAESAFGNRYTFQGREIDWSTGLIYFRARWYDPDSGRWLSNDPIGIAGGLNLYEFCGSNPVNFMDPYGLETHWEFNPGYWHFEGREALNSNLPTSPDAAIAQGGTRLPPEMSKYHDNKIGKPEIKIIFDDGREAVYDGDTCELITDKELGGTYNYVNPAEPSWNPLKWPEIAGRGAGHFFADMLPYYIGGNARGEG